MLTRTDHFTQMGITPEKVVLQFRTDVVGVPKDTRPFPIRPHLPQNIATDGGWKTYLRQMPMEGGWGSYVALLGLVNILDIPVAVMST